MDIQLILTPLDGNDSKNEKISMKTKISLLLLILANSLQLIVSQTWEYSNALENEWMRKICTHGLDTVYVVGNNGLIARSTDRSLTWNKQYPVTAQLNDIIFCNYTTGFYGRE